MTTDTAQVRIVFQGQCPKLTARGKGLLGYDLGIDDTNGNHFLRISSNAQGGTCSFEWIQLSVVESILAKRDEKDKPFSAVTFKKAYVRRSANNHGYLAAILKAERVISSFPEKPIHLSYLSFDAIKAKIIKLSAEKTEHPDLVAADVKTRSERKKARSDSANKVVTRKEKTTPS